MGRASLSIEARELCRGRGGGKIFNWRYHVCWMVVAVMAKSGEDREGWIPNGVPPPLFNKMGRKLGSFLVPGIDWR